MCMMKRCFVMTILLLAGCQNGPPEDELRFAEEYFLGSIKAAALDLRDMLRDKSRLIPDDEGTSEFERRLSNTILNLERSEPKFHTEVVEEVLAEFRKVQEMPLEPSNKDFREAVEQLVEVSQKLPGDESIFRSGD